MAEAEAKAQDAAGQEAERELVRYEATRGVALLTLDDRRIAVATPSGARLLLSLDETLAWHCDSYLYAPTFGVRTPATVLRGRTSSPLPRSVRMRFEVSAPARP